MATLVKVAASLGGFYRSLGALPVVGEDCIALDFSDEEDLLRLRICGIESHFVLGLRLSIFAESVEYEWCFTPKEYLEGEEIGTWRLERVGRSREGENIRSTKCSARPQELAIEEFTTEAPTLFIKTSYSI